MAKFTVDTHLFRELGELLVGRDSTALIELIKNAYDADATDVIVYGERLDKPDEGRIHIVDNGVGMNAEDFENGFLRVASRLKEQGERRSICFKRRYTGAKGIGRLAAHKLARRLEIYSIPQLSELGQRRNALQAAIDWDEIERYETLDELESTDAIELKTLKANKDARYGTKLVLKRLRRGWTKTERARFFAEVQSFDPPEFLREPLPHSVISEPLLFAKPVVRDQGTSEDTSPFQVRLEGEFAAGEEYWMLLAEMSAWVLEIRARRHGVKIAIAPTKKTLSVYPEAKELCHSVSDLVPENGPHFDARILVREGRRDMTQDQRVWATNASGVRVYMEGFRVLPYGEPKNDWLSLDSDYTRRPRQLEMLRGIGLEAETQDRDAGLIRLPSNNYFGAVFLTQESSSNMRLLVNREGFVPEAGFDSLTKTIRVGIDLLTRERAAAAFERRQKRRERRHEGNGKELNPPSSVQLGDETGRLVETITLQEHMSEAADLMEQVGTHLSGDEKEVTAAAIRELDAAKVIVEDLISERMLLYVLASVGTQMAAFVHEISNLLGAAQTMEYALKESLAEERLSLGRRDSSVRKLRHVMNMATELKRGLERQASYLTEVVAVDALRRRSRQRLHERFVLAVRLVQHEAEQRNINIDNHIPHELRSPPMFPAELTVVFANLLTNAVKAAGESGHIHVSGASEGDQIRIRIQNTGTTVQLDEAERWFRPFQSTTSEVDPVLGQGMGLGLTITRNLLENYGASVKFVQPDESFSTAVEISLPERTRA